MTDADTNASFVCHGCQHKLQHSSNAAPFRCPESRQDDDIDHVLQRPFPAGLSPLFQSELAALPSGEAWFQTNNPLIDFRGFSFLYHLAAAVTPEADRARADADLVALIERFSDSVQQISGAPFRTTPAFRSTRIAERLGFNKVDLHIKNETNNVAGSHKARHLAGILLFLLWREASQQRPTKRPTLAIASCGNAALAAATLARAADWPLLTFVPRNADHQVLGQIRALRAQIETCERDGKVGDPCYRAFRAAIDRGALPFCCQGPDNGLCIDGGQTLAYEWYAQLEEQNTRLDYVFIQVGGGALGSALYRGWMEMRSLGLAHSDGTRPLPRFCFVQTSNTAPLKRAYDRIVKYLANTYQISIPDEAGKKLADWVSNSFSVAQIEQAITYAARHRSEFMWPWEQEPRSIARGILDDETYDWHTLIAAMLRTSGFPVIVSESELKRAQGAAVDQGASHTGSAGLAGAMQSIHSKDIAAHEVVGAVLTGTHHH